MKRTNAIRSLLLSASLAGAVFAAPAYAQVSFNISIAPPAPYYEVVPTLSPGYIWAPGYWGWSGERHVWIRGRSIVHREGYNWAPDRWEQGNSGYYRTAGHWEHDNNYRYAKPKKEKNGRDHDNRGGRGNNGRGDKHDGGDRHGN
ncbi:MAG: YXWGXW repeat-containing protein [Burkholderiales bacterium]|nr:YXWGXW repeat-containing protein [Burkholderiales bacterium]